MIKLRDFNFTLCLVTSYYPHIMDREMDVLITEMPESYTWKGEGKNLSFLSKKKKKKKTIFRNKYLNVAHRICRPQSE